MNKNLVLRITSAISILGMITVNILANILPINGKYTGELSDAIKTYFVPAGYVFSIWGVIYIALIIYIISTFLKKEDNDVKIAPYIILSSIANISWIFLWHYEQVILSVIPMIILLISLIFIYTIQNKERVGVLKKFPFSIYLGWISVATISNISAALLVSNWSALGLSGQMWSSILIAISTGLAILILNIKKDILFSLVILWALIGIMFKFVIESDLIVGACIVALTVILINILQITFQKETK